MRVFAVSGFSGTGKTTLVEQVIHALVEEGYAVASVKSTQHNIHEEEGTDTWRHRRAGAKDTILISPTSSVVTYSGKKNLLDLLGSITADFLIIEGLKESPIPKIWCIGKNPESVDSLPQSVRAIVTSSTEEKNVERGVPVIQSDEIDKIIELIKREAMELSKLQAWRG